MTPEEQTTFHGDYDSQRTHVINFKQSRGNYMVDKKGNMILDLNAAAAGQILGYNNEHLTNARDSELYDKYVTHKADVSSLPPQDFADIVR